MGLFSRTTEKGVVGVMFSGENEAFVYSGTVDGEWVTYVTLVCWYYARMLNNLGDADEVARNLLEAIDSLVHQALREGSIESSILPDGVNVSADAPSNPTAVYTGVLFQRGDGTFFMNTEVTPGGEGWYAPISVLALLQDALGHLEPPQQLFAWLSIAGMHQYYAEHGWTDTESINLAPSAGMLFAMKAAKSSRGSA